MVREIDVGGKLVGENQKTFIIAEVGLNHNGDMSIAKKIIEEAGNAGADAVKFQTFITEKRVGYLSNSNYLSQEKADKILRPNELTFEQLKELKEYAESKDLIFFSTPFDTESVDNLDRLGVSLYKIASFHTNDKQLIHKIAEKGKPVIMSTGVSEIKSIEDAIDILQEKCPVILLHCMSSYPTRMEDASLINIQYLKERYKNLIVGYSDHTKGIFVPVQSIGYGANVLEVHMTLKHTEDGPHDDVLSKDPQEFSEMIKQIRNAEKLIGKPREGIYTCERDLINYTKLFDKGDK